MSKVYTITLTSNHNGPIITVDSPYSPAFVTAAKGIGGRWDRTTRTWQFGHRLDHEVKKICADVYDKLPAPITTPIAARYLGNVGDKLTLTVLVERVRDFDRVFRGQTTSTRFHVMRAATGEQVIWRSSSAKLDAGEEYVLTGTVKEHGVYRDTLQTVMTRCKVVGPTNQAAITPSTQTVSTLASQDVALADEVQWVDGGEETSGEFIAVPVPAPSYDDDAPIEF